MLLNPFKYFLGKKKTVTRKTNDINKSFISSNIFFSIATCIPDCVQNVITGRPFLVPFTLQCCPTASLKNQCKPMRCNSYYISVYLILKMVRKFERSTSVAISSIIYTISNPLLSLAGYCSNTVVELNLHSIIMVP